jgi:hypothetical protein
MLVFTYFSRCTASRPERQIRSTDRHEKQQITTHKQVFTNFAKLARVWKSDKWSHRESTQSSNVYSKQHREPQGGVGKIHTYNNLSSIRNEFWTLRFIKSLKGNFTFMHVSFKTRYLSQQTRYSSVQNNYSVKFQEIHKYTVWRDTELPSVTASGAYSYSWDSNSSTSKKFVVCNNEVFLREVR